MLFVYPAVFHHEDNSYWVEFPDLPGCQSFGDSVIETLEYAQEALSGYILTLLEDNKALPKASDINLITVDSNSFTSLISCSLSPAKETKAVKKTLTIPSWLNERAMAQGINFSQTLQDALLSKIQS